MTSFQYRTVSIAKVLESRYPNHERPLSWDARIAGYDRVITTDGEQITLLSNGQQSTPEVGWKLMLTEENMIDAVRAYSWTLYGLPSAIA